MKDLYTTYFQARRVPHGPRFYRSGDMGQLLRRAAIQ